MLTLRRRNKDFLIVTTGFTGVTLISFLYGAQSTPYYLIIGFLAASLSLHYAFTPGRAQAKGVDYWLFVTGFLFIDFVIQILNYGTGSSGYDAGQNAMQLIANSLVILFCVYCGNVNKSDFHKITRINIILIVPIIVYGLYKGGATGIVIGEERFTGGGFRESIWAEISLGVFLLGMLQNGKLLKITTFLVLMAVAFYTQIRSAGLAGVLVVILNYFLQIRPGARINRNSIYLFFLVFGAFTVFAAANYQALFEYISKILLFEDEHRGINSGLSGRTEILMAGLERFYTAPFFGVGVTDEVAGFVHNGYIRACAQYGIFIGIIYIWATIKALHKSFLFQEKVYFSCLAGAVFFVNAQPRLLNLQLMPLVGVVFLFRILINRDFNK